jgi:hypothetical protein
MVHDQVRDSVFVQAQEGVLAGRRKAQATRLRHERDRLVTNMQNQAERVSKIDRLLFLLE